MKIKVDKKEYEQLLNRVEQLEKDNANNWKEVFDAERRFRQGLEDYLDSYFADKCRVIMIKRDRDVIVAEIRGQVIQSLDNVFKEQEEE